MIAHRFFVPLALLATGNVFAEMAPQATVNLPSTPGLPALLPSPPATIRNAFSEGYDATEACSTVKLWPDGDIDIRLPARFPNPERQLRLMETYRLNCPNFLIERVRGKSITIYGLSPAQLDNYLYKGDDNNEPPSLWDVGEFWLDLTEPNVIRPTRVVDASPEASVVVGARQGKSPLQPVVFNRGALNVEYDPTLPVEILRNTSAGWTRAVWVPAQNVLHFDMNYPFPTN